MSDYIQDIFPTPIYVADDIDVSSLAEQARTAKYVFDGSQTYQIGDEHILKQKHNDQIRDVIKQHIDKLIYDTLHYKKDEIPHLDICDSWFTKSTSRGSGQYHYHAWSWYSGILYLDDLGGTYFSKAKSSIPTDFFGFQQSEDSPWLSDSFYFNSLRGRLLLFKSTLFHRPITDKLSDDQTRYSLAFNIVPRGRISNDPTARLTMLGDGVH